MKVLMTGATGWVGRTLAPELLKRGHTLRCLVRDVDKATATCHFPAEWIEWRSIATPLPDSAFQNINAIVHLMGEPIAGQRWTKEFKQRVYSSRVDSTRKIAEQVKKHKIANFISASAIGFYGDRGDQELDETAAVGEGFMPRVCKDWERELFSAREIARCVALRIGIVLGKEGVLQKMLLPFRLGMGGDLGSGRQWMSWIHLSDLHRLLIESLENGNYMGAINATGPKPIPQSEFAHCLSSTLHRPCLLKTPEWVLKLALGEMSELLLDSIRVVPRKAMHLGFRFQFPELQPALESILSSSS